jgi:hypothetical protein
MQTNEATKEISNQNQSPVVQDLLDTIKRINLRAVRQQAKGGGLFDFQDALRECADMARATISRYNAN